MRSLTLPDCDRRQHGCGLAVRGGDVLRALRLTSLLAGLIVLFSVLMVAAFCVPDAPIRRHMSTSVEVLELEGHPYHPLLGLHSLMPDNYTDALKLNQALNPIGASPVRAAFGNYMLVQFDPGFSPVTIDSPIDAIPSLRVAYEGGPGVEHSYSRYWHGYQVVLRPLLALFDYRAIRFLNILGISLLFCASVLAVRFRLGLGAALSMTSAFILTGIVGVPLSLQYMGVFTVMLIGVFWAARSVDASGGVRHDLEVFLTLGAVTAFLDLLTVPALTILMPLAVILTARARADLAWTASHQLGYILKIASVWAFGYVGAWVSKWAIASVALGDDVFRTAITLAARQFDGVSVSGEWLGRADALLWNGAMLVPAFGLNQSISLQWPVVFRVSAILLVALAALCWAILRHPRAERLANGWPGLLLVSLAPYAWYVLLHEHSLIHFWFTYRLQAVTIFVLLFVAFRAIDPGYLSGLKRRVLNLLGADTA